MIFSILQIGIFFAVAVFIAVGKAKATARNSAERSARVNHKAPEDEDESSVSAAERIPAPAADPASGGLRPGQSRQVKDLCTLFDEDRRHDWMAKQLREERRHMVWNNFQDLGARHDVSCAVQEAREAHHREHESGVVDDGVIDD